MKSACPNLDVIGLLQDATAAGPKFFQTKDKFLKSHHVVISTLGTCIALDTLKCTVCKAVN
jgi:hypothetical protein